MRRPSASTTGSSSTSVASSGHTCSQPRALSEPTIQTKARATSKIRPSVSTYAMPACAKAATPIPASTSRCPWTPCFQASA